MRSCVSQRSKRYESAGIGYHPSALAITLGDWVNAVGAIPVPS